MSTTQILMDEHRVIEQVLNCLEKLSEKGQADGRLNAEHARTALDFLRNFADRLHHCKEEDLLFPAMEDKGFSPEAGPTAVMRHEHEQGRTLIRGMAEAIDEAAAGDAAAIGAFARHANAYVALLREHIQKEDHCLFPMAQQAFDETEEQALLDRFEKAEAEELAPGTREKYVGIANELADRYGVEHADI